MLAASDWTFGQLMWSFLVFFTWILFFWMLFAVIGDIFRRHDISGWGKAGWIIFTVCLPFLGIFVYLIARGGKMHQHAVQDQQAADAAFTAYVQQATGTTASTADELQKLAALRDQGVITPAEFETQKAKILA